MRLPDPECAFFYAVLAQLDPDMRPVFAERVARYLGAHPDPGPGTIDRAIRQSLQGLWTPPPDEEKRAQPKWSQRADRRDGWSSGARQRNAASHAFPKALSGKQRPAKKPVVVAFPR